MKKFVTILAVLFSGAAFSQNVGIGETTPTAMKLQVKAADSAVVLIQNSTVLGSNIKTGLFFKTGSFYSGNISTIGSGATFRMGLFTYGGATPSALIERISIADGGNVGIGKTFPQKKLDVAGDLKADTILPNAIRMAPNAGEGKVLTSDAVGNATWKNTAYGNNERFQFNIKRPAPSNNSGTFSTLYSFGTTSGSSINLAPNGIDRTITIYFTKTGLYHFDWNVYSYFGAGNYTNNGRKLFYITKCTSGCVEVLKTLKNYDTNDYLSFDRTFEMYISEVGTSLYFTTQASYNATNDDFYMTITGHLISE
jgi:hypothetical protein